MVLAKKFLRGEFGKKLAVPDHVESCFALNHFQSRKRKPVIRSSIRIAFEDLIANRKNFVVVG